MSKVQVIRYIRCLIIIMILALCNIYPLNAEVIVQSLFETDCQNYTPNFVHSGDVTKYRFY
jgi:hypothetical protein